MGDIIRLQLDSLKEAVRKENRPFLVEYLLENMLVAHSPVQVLVQIRALEKILAMAAQKAIDLVLERGLEKDQPPVYGAEVKIKRTPAKWDYETCGDPVLAELEAKLAEVKKDIKGRQQFLQNIGGEDVDKSTGEVIKTTSITIDHLGKKITVNRAGLEEAGQTVEVRLPS
jgi:hypothetical protein